MIGLSPRNKIWARGFNPKNTPNGFAQRYHERKRALTKFTISAALFAICFGAATGLGGYTFLYARGASYLTDDPRVCANCHVMSEQYNAWSRSSHHAVAVCNDCHTPHDFLSKYYTKALNGFRHSLHFTTGHFHEPIQITPRNRRVTEANCRRCHAEVVQAIDARHLPGSAMECIRCHSSVGHWTH